MKKFLSYKDNIVWLDHFCLQIRGNDSCVHGEWIEDNNE